MLIRRERSDVVDRGDGFLLDFSLRKLHRGYFILHEQPRFGSEIREQSERQFHKTGPGNQAARELLRKFKGTGSVYDAGGTRTAKIRHVETRD